MNTQCFVVFTELRSPQNNGVPGIISCFRLARRDRQRKGFGYHSGDHLKPARGASKNLMCLHSFFTLRLLFWPFFFVFPQDVRGVDPFYKVETLEQISAYMYCARCLLKFLVSPRRGWKTRDSIFCGLRVLTNRRTIYSNLHTYLHTRTRKNVQDDTFGIWFKRYVGKFEYLRHK